MMDYNKGKFISFHFFLISFSLRAWINFSAMINKFISFFVVYIVNFYMERVRQEKESFNFN